LSLNYMAGGQMRMGGAVSLEGSAGTRCKDGDIIFAVKIQVPLSDPKCSRGPCLVYNKDRSFHAWIAPPEFESGQCPQYDQVIKLITASKNPVKVYMNCKYNERTKKARIILNEGNILPTQPW